MLEPSLNQSNHETLLAMQEVEDMIQGKALKETQSVADFLRGEEIDESSRVPY